MLKYLSLFIFVFAACGAPESDQNEQTEQEGSTPEAAVEQSQPRNGVYFVNISELDTLESPFVMEMGIRGMEVEPKGKIREGFGHHHLLIDRPFVEEGIFMPADSTLIHYGGGETVDTVSLSPGKHYLTLQFGDGMHNSYGFDWSTSITVYVK